MNREEEAGPGEKKLKISIWGPFEFHEISKPLKQSVPLPPARFMEDIDPQPMQTITTEIASGRFEDDIRRMRMGAWQRR